MENNPEDVPVHRSGKLDRSHEVFIVQTAFFVMSLVCLLLRGYIKCFIIKANLLDDYLLYAAMTGYIVYTALVVDGSHNGGAIGKHPSLDITTDEAARGLRTWYITMVLYPWITLAIRGSVCVLLLRINTKRSFDWFIRGILAAMALCSVVFFFILVFQCSPPRYFWRQVYGESGHCFNRSIITHSTSVYSVLSAVSDWCMGLLPIAILWPVQMKRRTKIAIAGLLSLGVIAGIALIIRITYMTRLQPGVRFLYESTDVAIWSVLEPALGIAAACVATFRPLLRKCGFGSDSPKGGSAVYQLNELHPRDAFSPDGSNRGAAGGFESMANARSDDKGKVDDGNGSEYELTSMA